MTDNQLIEYFLANADLFSNNNIFFSGFRALGWLIVKGFVFVADISEDLYDTAFGLVDFTTWAEGTEFMNAFKPVFVALMAISLFALGIMLMMGKDKKPKIVQNICIACLCVTCSTIVFTELNNLTISFKEGVESIKTGGKAYDGAYDIVSDNLYDLVYLDSQLGMKNINYEENKDELPHPNITKKSFGVIDYDEIINYDTERFSWKSGGEAQTILKSELVSTGDEYTIGEVRIIENTEANRLQVFFPEKPSEEVRKELKSNGFRWASIAVCWQSYLNDRQKNRIEQILKNETAKS